MQKIPKEDNVNYSFNYQKVYFRECVQMSYCPIKTTAYSKKNKSCMLMDM